MKRTINRHRMKRGNNVTTGFTLIELLVVISIISLLIAILLPALGKAREASRRVQCATKVRALAQASIVYSMDYKNVLPMVEAPYNVANGYFATRAAGKQILQQYMNYSMATGVYRAVPMKCPSNPYGVNGAAQPSLDYSYNGNTAAWPGVGRTPWLDITYDMVNNIANKYHARWGLYFDRVSTNWGDTSYKGPASTSHREGDTFEGGNVAWADGSTSWEGYDNGAGWVSMDSNKIMGPKAGINLYINHPGGGEVRFVGALSKGIFSGSGTDASQVLGYFQ